jgi:hypothetical protein
MKYLPKPNFFKMLALSLLGGLTLTFSQISSAADPNAGKVPTNKPRPIYPLDKARNIDLCVAYSTLKTEKEKKAVMAELDKRTQLSEKDHENLKKKLVEPGNTTCGMYMILGKPLQEKGVWLRPMVFKVVHVYPKHYYVTQVGMVMNKYERKPGEMPPKLIEKAPKVQGPPVIFEAPGGRPMHPGMEPQK